MASSCSSFEQDSKVIYVLYDAVAFFHSVMPFHGTREDIYVYVYKKGASFPAPIFTNLRNSQQHAHDVDRIRPESGNKCGKYG